MRTYYFQSKLRLPRPREEVFDFFADPGNLERLTPPWLRFTMLTPPPIVMGVGVVLDYRIKLHGVPIAWQSVIDAWEPPQRFIDRQTKGPYSLWIHEHGFIADNGGTIVCDDVAYAVPGGWLVRQFLVAPDLKRIFAYRRAVLEELFAGGSSAEAPPNP